MRKLDNEGEDELYYLHTDHLGSTSLVTYGQLEPLTPRMYLPLVTRDYVPSDGMAMMGGLESTFDSPLAMTTFDSPLSPPPEGQGSAPEGTTFEPGQVVARLLYDPYGEVRWSWLAEGSTFSTDLTYTGQRDVGLGLMHYGARFYDPYLNRFISADSIVPDLSNPQDWNRYAYVRNNPLRYVDPSGHFTNDEIMTFFGVDTWDEVLAIFRVGGELEGLWGWLSTLEKASEGDALEISHRISKQNGGPCSFLVHEGIFTVSEDGALYVSGVQSDLSIYEAGSLELGNRYRLFAHYTYSGKYNEVKTPIEGGGRWSDYLPYGGRIQLVTLKANPDWDNVAADIASLAASAFPSLFVVEALATGYNVYDNLPELRKGDRSAQVDLAIDLIGTAPAVGVPADIISLYRDFNFELVY